MLEDDLKFAKIELTVLKITSPIILILGSVYFWKGNTDKDPAVDFVILIAIGIALSLFVIARSHAKKLYLERYLFALKNKNFDEALNYGKIYYGLKRNGMIGLFGRGLKIGDEQAISNDISAYSKI
ncbi:hypothetical protein DU508_05250 [Pedobacter chinensis]|uniref:Uncharacterized protein n=1 Tax=Pedobacter chinensis TaxID=2282421 RepID=A0A369Q1J0_9SPHI|nr:hypothetical protein [Pedobacter chinensis]RDC58340.1 hypothetical protein DU508_05250 [Pedobacter chinensis]